MSITAQWLDQAIKLYNNGMPYYKIAKTIGVSRKTVSYHLRKAGLQSNPKYTRTVDPAKLRKYDYSIADSVFEIIDTEEKAYWLGMLYADGYIDDSKHSVSLSLKEADREHVEKFRHFLGLDAKKIHVKTKNIKSKQYIGYEFTFSSVKTVNDLARCGCTSNKTFSLQFPNESILPEKLRFHFIRGYMDGDGSITHGGKNASVISLEILGTEAFLTSYQKNVNFSDRRLYTFKHSKIKRSVINGPYAIYVLDKLYKNAHIYLLRKYETYLRLRRLALESPRTARLLADKIGEDLTVNTEVTNM